ncbi:WD repeat-containing protein 74 [Etheostoma cragini]|uniref:WD repeat-containing protein 74 n=1 Tax=Etheostoma cragini TaxID=417921 RepID=UPI00155EC00A|nr:WD repeat-containing protein 74 [Etheostoma cragini]
MGDTSRLCSVWLGSETGILKGVSLSRKQAFNFCNTSHLSRDQEVRALCWGDPAESEVLVGSVDGTVKTFSVEKGAFTDTRRCGEPADGCFAGLALSGSALVTCAERGALRVWREDSSEPAAELHAGDNVCRMRQSAAHRDRVATGGKENGLKIWDLERPEQPVFAAKNLRDDWLDLRRPQWVRDMAFIPDSDKVVTCTGYHQVHVLDPSTSLRDQAETKRTAAERQREELEDAVRGRSQGTQSEDAVRGRSQGTQSEDAVRGCSQRTQSEDAVRGRSQGTQSGDAVRGRSQGTWSEDAVRGRSQRTQSEVSCMLGGT